MDNIKTLKHNLERAAWGLFAILWGITILFDFVPFAVGLAGTGLILLGVNLILRMNQLPARADNAILGILLLAWGGLEFARPWLHGLLPSADLDWAIFAILLIGLGVILLVRALLAARSRPFGTFAGAHKE